MRLLFGELRQGALEGVLVEAVARAAGIPPPRVRRAAMLAGDARRRSRDAALADGERGAGAVHPAAVPAGAADARRLGRRRRRRARRRSARRRSNTSSMARASRCTRSDDEVRVFSRNLRDVTVAVPEVVDGRARLPARELILDGEAIALRAGRHAAAVSGSPCAASAGSSTSTRCAPSCRSRRSSSTRSIVDGDALIDEPLIAARRAARRAGCAAANAACRGSSRPTRTRRPVRRARASPPVTKA